MLSIVQGPLAARFPIFFSDNPWALLVGLLVTVALIVYRMSRKTAAERMRSIDTHLSGRVDPAFDEVEHLLGDPRYRKAMSLLSEDRQVGSTDATRRALAYLEQNGVARTTAAMNLAKLAHLQRAVRAAGRP